VAASGPLGLFGSSATGFSADTGPGPSSGYLPFINSASPSINSSNVGNFDEVDLNMNYVDEYVGAVDPGPPTSADAYIYRCQTTACMADFLLPGEVTVGPLGPGGTAQFTATAIPADPPTNTPEPPMILLSATGISGLAGVTWHQNRRSHDRRSHDRHSHDRHSHDRHTHVVPNPLAEFGNALGTHGAA
jgi:hypothetical protein